LKTCISIMALAIIFYAGDARAQSPDSFLISNDTAPPGGMATISIYLHNTQFSVGGFSAMFVLQDSSVARFIEIERGADIADFEHFGSTISDGTIRIVGVVNLPGGGNPGPLAIGYHELAFARVAINDNAPWGIIDSLFFGNDGLPPERDNSISDSTGYINEIPTLVPGWILFDIFQGADDSPAGLPSRLALARNYPNPFNGETMISFELPSYAGRVSIGIYDLVGRLVKTYKWNDLGPGTHNVVWNGSDSRGQPVASGIYFYRLEVDSQTAGTMRMTLLK